MIINLGVKDVDEAIAGKAARMAANGRAILDIGRSARQLSKHFKPGQLTTLDIDPRVKPNILADICDPYLKLEEEAWDGVICCSILEHVIDPWMAMVNIERITKPGGQLLGWAPFLYRYHSSPHYPDCYRFSRDGLQHLLRRYGHVEIYPVRGRVSTLCNLFAIWKNKVEPRLGLRVNAWVDWFDRQNRATDVSGHFFWGVK